MARQRAVKGSGTCRARNEAKTTWELKWWMPDESKYAYKTFHGSEREAQKELRKITSLVDAGELVVPSKLMIKEVITKYLSSIEGTVADKTYQEYVSKIHHHILPVFGKKKMDELKLDYIQDWINKAKKNGSVIKGKPLSGQTIKHCLTIMHTIYEWAIDKELCGKNPVNKRKLTIPEIRGVRYPNLTKEQIKQLLAAFDNTQWSIAVHTACFSGMRRGEILGLTWDACNLEEGTITVMQSLSETKDKICLKQTKNIASEDVIAIPPILVARLNAHKEQQRLQKLVAGLAYNDQGFICADELGNPFSPDKFSWMFSYYMKKLGLPVRFHDLRHQMAMVLGKQKVGIKTISGLLRHSSSKTTMDIYQHKDMDMEREAVEEFQRFLEC